MSKKTNLPSKLKTSSSGLSAFDSLPLLEFGVEAVSTICKIVDSNNRCKVEMHAISVRGEIEREKIEMDYQDRCNKWRFASQTMNQAFLSDKISGDQIVELARTFS